MSDRAPRLLPPPTPEARAAFDNLAHAITAATNNGQHIPCQGRNEWISEHLYDLQAAATACRWCPVIDACRNAAETSHPVAGAWAGRIYTDRPANAAATDWLQAYLNDHGPSLAANIQAAAATTVRAPKTIQAAARRLNVTVTFIGEHTTIWSLPDHPVRADRPERSAKETP